MNLLSRVALVLATMQLSFVDTLAKRLEHAARRAGWTHVRNGREEVHQARVAEAAGLTPGAVSRALKRERGFSSENIRRLAHALGVERDWLESGVGPMKPAQPVALAADGGDVSMAPALYEAIAAATIDGDPYSREVILTIARRYGRDELDALAFRRLLDQERRNAEILAEIARSARGA